MHAPQRTPLACRDQDRPQATCGGRDEVPVAIHLQAGSREARAQSACMQAQPHTPAWMPSSLAPCPSCVRGSAGGASKGGAAACCAVRQRTHGRGGRRALSKMAPMTWKEEDRLGPALPNQMRTRSPCAGGQTRARETERACELGGARLCAAAKPPGRQHWAPQPASHLVSSALRAPGSIHLVRHERRLFRQRPLRAVEHYVGGLLLEAFVVAAQREVAAGAAPSAAPGQGGSRGCSLRPLW